MCFEPAPRNMCNIQTWLNVSCTPQNIVVPVLTNLTRQLGRMSEYETSIRLGLGSG